MARKFTGDLSASALATLTAATCYPSGPPRVVLPAGQLPRADYEDVNEVLTRIGGKWVSGKTKAHVFESDPSADLATVIESGQFPPDNPLDFFPTPPELASEIVRLLDLPPIGTRFGVLEPSAGRGNLISALYNSRPNDANNVEVVAYELNPKHAQYLFDNFEGVTVRDWDFLKYDPEWQDDFYEPVTRVLMNPPFGVEGDGNVYMAHIRHAFDNFLAPGGVLVSVVPTGATFGTTKKHQDFRAFVEANDGEFMEVPAGSFKVSGTMVSTAMLRMRKRSVK